MIKEQTLDFVKNEAAELGRKFGIYLATLAAPKEIKEAWLTILPNIEPAAIRFAANSDLERRLSALWRATTRGKVSGSFDDSTIDLIVREMFLRNALEAASFRLYGLNQAVRRVGTDVGDLEKAVQRLCGFYKIVYTEKSNDAELSSLIKKITRLAFGQNLPKNEPTFQASNESDYTDDPILLNPPKHTWDGPQPGLLEQVDNCHRYVFSARTGALDYVIKYADNNRPMSKIWYKIDPNSNELKATEIEVWQNNHFESTGKINQENASQMEFLPRYYFNDNGQELAIPLNDPKIFITPNGTLVRLISTGSLLRGPRAEYLGRVKGFNPLFPFMVQTTGGVAPIAVHRVDIVIDTKGNVYEFSPTGLRVVGELAFTSQEKIPNTTFRARSEFFDFTLCPQTETGKEITLVVNHPTIQKFITGPLHTIVGTHTFVQSRVPELTDVNGGTAGEFQLRTIEELAIKIALLSNALHEESLTPAYAALLQALHFFEDQLWQAVVKLEQIVGMERNTLVDMVAVRAWLAMAKTDPVRAVLALKNTVTPRYAA